MTSRCAPPEMHLLRVLLHHSSRDVTPGSSQIRATVHELMGELAVAAEKKGVCGGMGGGFLFRKVGEVPGIQEHKSIYIGGRHWMKMFLLTDKKDGFSACKSESWP